MQELKQNQKSIVGKEGEIVRELELFWLYKFWIFCHFLLNRQINQLLHYFLFPFRLSTIYFRHKDALNEVLFLRNYWIYLLFTSEVILYDLLWKGKTLATYVLRKVLVTQIYKDWLLFVRNYGKKFFYFLRERLLFSLGCLHQMRMKVELLFLVWVEKVQDLNHYLPHLRVELYMVLGLLAYIKSE